MPVAHILLGLLGWIYANKNKQRTKYTPQTGQSGIFSSAVKIGGYCVLEKKRKKTPVNISSSFLTADCCETCGGGC